jgi:hypothetical protein
MYFGKRGTGVEGSNQGLVKFNSILWLSGIQLCRRQVVTDTGMGSKNPANRVDCFYSFILSVHPYSTGYWWSREGKVEVKTPHLFWLHKTIFMWIIGLYLTFIKASLVLISTVKCIGEIKTQLHICDRLDNPVHVKRMMAAKMWRVCKGR